MVDWQYESRVNFFYYYLTPDSQSDHEVPYADIVISVRGSSNPDISDTLTQTSKNQRPVTKYIINKYNFLGIFFQQVCLIAWDLMSDCECVLQRWRDETRAGLLHASADRLHIRSKEVTRKLSTTSEYAVITYSCEALS